MTATSARSFAMRTVPRKLIFSFFFFNDTATTEIYTLSLHDALPISLTVTLADGSTVQITESTVANGIARSALQGVNGYSGMQLFANDAYSHYHSFQTTISRRWNAGDRKSTRLNSSH